MSAFVWLAALFAAYCVWRGLQQNSRRLALPPGPKGLPIIGNLKDMTLTGLWSPAQKWAQQFGEHFFFPLLSSRHTGCMPRWILTRNSLPPGWHVAGELVYLNVFGQGLLFVNTYEAAVDLLEKRGAIYSDKPKMVMAGEL